VIRLNQTEDLSIENVRQVVLENKHIEIDRKTYDHLEKSLAFLLKFSKDKVIYGINTGLGPMAQYKIDDDKLHDLQYNLIRSHAAGAGEKLPDEYVKVAMLVRLRAIIQGFSGIDPSCITLLQELINNNVFPFIPEHGGVGASGDLVQLSHLALVLIGEGKVSYKGKLTETSKVFNELNLKPISIKLREGLSLINGTSVMTGIGVLNVIKSRQLFNWTLLASALLNEIVESFDDHFSIELNKVKKHQGQDYVASLLRSILADSKMISRREEHFFHNQENQRIFKRKVQEYYSIRCLPQILGPVIDTIEQTATVIENEMNSVSDNPIVDLDAKSIFHGGNFHGDYVSLEMDKLKLAVIRMSMLSERQSAFIFNNKVNEILPHFVNLGTLGLNLGMQGVQFTATSTTAENQALSTSLYVHSITTNNDNQDIVSMGTNAALLTKKVIENSYQVLSIELMALLQAVDYLKIQNKLSSYTAKLYHDLRELVPVFVEDTPKYEEIEAIKKFIFNKNPLLPGKK
jgi:histidine ammonia-lyase